MSRTARLLLGGLFVSLVSCAGSASSGKGGVFDADGKFAGVGKVKGFSAEDPRTAKEALLAGGLICEMKVGADGDINSANSPGAVSRSVLVTLEYDVVGVEPNVIVSPHAVFVPVDPNRVPNRVKMFPKEGDSKICISWPHLPAVSLDQLREARGRSKIYSKHPCEIRGKRGWWALSPVWEEEENDLVPTLMVAELYREDPDLGAMPIGRMDVARRVPGEWWQPMVDYLHPLMEEYRQGPDPPRIRVTSVVEGGVPVRVEASQVPEPLFEDLLVTRDSSTVKGMSRNDHLLKSKNRVVPKLLKERETADLSALETKVSRALQALEKEVQSLTSRAVKVVEAKGTLGQITAKVLRDRITIYKERGEILKSILASLRTEIASREK